MEHQQTEIFKRESSFIHRLEVFETNDRSDFLDIYSSPINLSYFTFLHTLDSYHMLQLLEIPVNSASEEEVAKKPELLAPKPTDLVTQHKKESLSSDKCIDIHSKTTHFCYYSSHKFLN